ncbi:MAG TPA: hypothetical protein VGD80_16855, partial [Kofleriaceae bacterium]
MGVDDGLRDREAEARATRLGGDEWVEDLPQDIARNARAIVGDGEDRGVGLGARVDGDLAARRGGLGRIDDDVRDDLPQATRIGGHHDGFVGNDVHAAVLQCTGVLETVDGFARESREVDGLNVEAMGARQVEELGDDALALPGFVVDDRE